MKLYLVQWKYHDDTMTCGVMETRAKAEQARDVIRTGLTYKFFKEWKIEPEIEIVERELNSLYCEEAGF